MSGPTPDLLVGAIRSVRTFDVSSDGLLLPMVGSPQPWADGPNTAVAPARVAALVIMHFRYGISACRRHVGAKSA